ncbi:MAG: diguanylate cyclase [Nitrospirae bacterium]|nr:diguanylate cyclase [Nitrospirota bacterium]
MVEILKNIEERYYSVLETANEAIISTDANGSIISWNRAAETIFGYRSNEISGKPITYIVPELQLLNEFNKRADLSDSEKKPEIIARMVESKGLRKDNTELLIEVSLSTYKTNDGNYFTAVIQDISGSREREDALKNSELRYRSLFDESPVSILEEDFSEVKKYINSLRISGVEKFSDYFGNHPEEVAKCASTVKIIDINKATLELYEYENKEHLMKSLSRIFSGESSDTFRQELIALAENKTVFEAEAVNYTLKGNKKYIHLKLSLMADVDKTWSKVIVSMNDITERKKAMEAMERFNEELVEKVRERTKELEEARQAAERLSLIDGLTGIANRRQFDEYLNREWHRAIRSGKLLSLVMADIDFFKLYNDNYGHLTGDDCLRKVAHALAEVLKRQTDMVARYGGEEFVCVLTDTNAEGVLSVAKQLREKVNSLQIPHAYSPIEKHVTLSFGVAMIIPSTGQLPAELIKRADEMLYEAKGRGRNQIRSIDITTQFNGK